MFKILVFLAVIILVATFLLRMRLSNPGLISSNPLGNIFQNIFDSKKNEITDAMSQTVKNETQKMVNDAKSSLKSQVQTTADNINSTIDTQTPNISDVKNTPSSSEEVVQVNTGTSVLGASSDENLTEIDFQKDRNLNLNISKNKPYFLKFQNMPDNFCLFINNNSYPISNNMVEILFTTDGTYTLKTDFCDPEMKNIGKIVVN